MDEAAFESSHRSTPSTYLKFEIQVIFQAKVGPQVKIQRFPILGSPTVRRTAYGSTYSKRWYMSKEGTVPANNIAILSKVKVKSHEVTKNKSHASNATHLLWAILSIEVESDGHFVLCR